MGMIGFALAVLLIELTSGPNMAWLAGLLATEGRRPGLAAVAGIALGLLANGMLAALGLAALLDAEPRLWIALRLTGAAMMIWLATEGPASLQRRCHPTVRRGGPSSRAA